MLAVSMMTDQKSMTTAGSQRRARVRGVLAAGWLLGIGACTVLDAPCPCGGHWGDPRTAQGLDPRTAIKLRAGAVHEREDHCLCRCGDVGEEIYGPPFEKDCAALEVACIDDRDRATKLTCWDPAALPVTRTSRSAP